MPLTRAEHWATREFHDFLMARKVVPFRWGTNDCALFCADGIASITGTDIASEFRGQYKTERGALAAINRVAGGKDIADAAAWCAQKHEMPEWDYPLRAQRGDLVVIEDAKRLISGLVHLDGRHVVAPGKEGLRRLSILNVRRAWRV